MDGASRREELAAICPDADPAEADWWVTTWDAGTPPAVGFLIPRGFEAYARILHPAHDDEWREVTWAEVASACGTTVHPEAQWHRVAEANEPVSWPGTSPYEGSLERSRFVALAEVLGRHTSTPDDTVVAFWNGFGTWPAAWWDLPVARQPGREYYLFRRPLDEVERLCVEAPSVGLALGDTSGTVSVFRSDGSDPVVPTSDELLRMTDGGEWQSPSEWWPADRAWATSNDTDLDSTLVGGTRALVDDLLADDRLEVLPWPTDGSLWIDADTINGR